MDPKTWHACLDEVRGLALEHIDAGQRPDVGVILERLRTRCPRPDLQTELDSNPARVAARRIEARR